MPADKNYESVKSFVCDDRVTLYIKLRHPIDEEFLACYREAFYKRGGSFPTFRASGAPTVSDLTFDGNCVKTNPFPNAPLPLAEAKTFLTEFDAVLGCADELYAASLSKRARGREEELRQAREAATNAASHNEFFKN